MVKEKTTKRGKKPQPGKVVSVRLNPSEIVLIQNARKDRNISLARVLKESVKNLTPEKADIVALKQDNKVLRKRLEDQAEALRSAEKKIQSTLDSIKVLNLLEI